MQMRNKEYGQKWSNERGEEMRGVKGKLKKL